MKKAEQENDDRADLSLKDHLDHKTCERYSLFKAEDSHSYTSEAKKDQIQAFERKIQEISLRLESTCKVEPSAAAKLPWGHTRDGDKVYVTVPPLPNAGEQLSSLLVLLSARVPNVAIQFTESKFVETEPSTIVKKYLTGITVALQGPPKSFNVTSSPIDLMAMALWHECCAMALSRPQGCGAKGFVLPDCVSGTTSAKKYLLHAFASMRSGITDEVYLGALATLQVLLKLWAKGQDKPAALLLKTQKISWGQVLLHSAKVEKKTIKKVVITRPVIPMRVSKSPWTWAAEAKLLATITDPLWEVVENVRKSWTALTAADQHSDFDEVVKTMKLNFHQMDQLSTSMHTVLGRRKKAITEQLQLLKLAPAKADKDSVWKWNASFNKAPGTDFTVMSKADLCPIKYLYSDRTEQVTALGKFFNESGEVMTSDASELTPTQLLLRNWYVRFGVSSDQYRTILGRIAADKKMVNIVSEDSELSSATSYTL
jgi:hypothetical protein